MILKIIYGLIILDIIVFLHELGHFVAAQISGITVESFSIGMGPVILHREWKGVDWRISLFPVGGYCGMKGEKEYAEALENDLESIPAGKDSLYGAHPALQIFTAFSGPLANLIIAFFAYSVIAFVGYSYWTAGNKITLASEAFPGTYSAAEVAGIKSGDEIIEIEGKKIEDFQGIYEAAALNPDSDLNVKVRRNGEILDFTVHTTMDKSTGEGKIGLASIPESSVEKVIEGKSLFPAMADGAKRAFETVGMTVKGIGILFKGVELTNAVSGPARITTMLGDTVEAGFSAGAKKGLVAVLELTALISISLFIMNLLPVPILDGGLILFALIQLITGKAISPKWRNRVQYVGLIFIGLLFFIAINSDIHYFLGSKK